MIYQIVIIVVMFVFASTAYAADGFWSSFGTTDELTEIVVPVDVALIKKWRTNFAMSSSKALRSDKDLKSLLYSMGVVEYIAEGKEHYSYNIPAVVEWVEKERVVHEGFLKDAVFEMEENKVTALDVGSYGSTVDVMQSAIRTVRALEGGQKNAIIITTVRRPKKELSDLNQMGIKELIASGTSTFPGSSKNRRHNIKAGVKKVSGTIVKKGEEFSFNKVLGDVTAETGFVPEIVIKKDGLKPEFGGGLCQVSSTLFRSVMNSGMKITNRRNHSFAVAHYKPYGTDATIYEGPIDFRFINDTPSDIVLWAEAPTPDVITFKIYGTKDDRIVKVKDPVHYDKKDDGSLKAEWVRTVTIAGKDRVDTFKSNYLPPALFKKEEEFVKKTEGHEATTEKKDTLIKIE